MPIIFVPVFSDDSHSPLNAVPIPSDHTAAVSLSAKGPFMISYQILPLREDELLLFREGLSSHSPDIRALYYRAIEAKFEYKNLSDHGQSIPSIPEFPHSRSTVILDINYLRGLSPESFHYVMEQLYAEFRT